MAAVPGTRPLRAPRSSHRVRTAFAVGAAVVGIGLLLSAGVLLRGRGPDVAPAGAASASPSASGSAAVDAAPYLLPEAVPAPPLDLADPEGNPFSLTEPPGLQTLVFFGYTHCPDVCPATTGILGEAIRAYGPGVRAAFVSIDPERDTGEWLRQYARFLPRGVTALTGAPAAIRATADAWGVKYAKVDTGDPEAYTMAHTADVFLVDAAGRLRARFPFGTESGPIVTTLRHVAASTPLASPAASPAQSPPATASGMPVLALRPRIVSSSIWAEPMSPVIFAIEGPAGPLTDPAADVRVQVLAADGAPAGAAVPATAVRPPGVDQTYFVANLDIPSPGAWRFAVSARAGAAPLQGTTGLVTALDGGSTPAIGAPAPAGSTPTLQDVGGDIRRLSTDPVPDRRLSERSTGDALAAHDPFVLVLDSYRFKATPACGRALGIIKYLVDRWPDAAFIHHEPYRYSLVTDTPVLEGSLADPVLTDVSRAWGIDDVPWDALSMPWVFVVDGDGKVRAKYQGVVGSEDIDVILAELAAGG